MFGPEVFTIPGKVRGYDSSQTAPHGEHTARKEMLPAEDGEEILVLQSQIIFDIRGCGSASDQENRPDPYPTFKKNKTDPDPTYS